VRAAEVRAADGIVLTATAPPDPIQVVGDRLRLQQVLANLLDNAMKYSPGGGRVHAEVTAVDGTARVEIVDHGRGIPEDARDRIFERFYRVDPELTGGVGGSGLGLYISKEIVERMGGRITVEANEPRGSRFVVLLPRA
jgi:signal transduction histidine kinase